MVGCCICEDIYKGQHNKQKYRIWTIMGRESELSYWYVVMYDNTYNKEYNEVNIEYPEIDIDITEIDDRITNQAIDIRKLPNYKDMSALEILHYRKVVIVPLIKEALKKGYIKPI